MMPPSAPFRFAPPVVGFTTSRAMAGSATATVEATSPALLEELESVPDALLLPLPEVLERGEAEPFRYCLNTSTLRGHNLSLPELVDVAVAAGYESIEPWVDEIEKFSAEGGDLRDLRARIQDLGMTVESGIGFFNFLSPGAEERKKGLEDARHAMGLLARIGAKRVAAPPWGLHAPDAPALDLLAGAERYRDLLMLGEQIGVVPQIEIWGFSRNVSRLGEAALIATEAGHPDACILADVYHLYKGGSPVSALGYLSGDALGVFHVNDYPAIDPDTIKDSDRVYPGDGIAPLTTVFRTLRQMGFTGVLSLELFNATYYAEEPLSVAKTGLEKLRDVVQKSFD